VHRNGSLLHAREEAPALNVALIQPPLDFYMISPPLGLCQLAAILERERHDVKIIDCNLKGSKERIEREMRRGLDAVGISSVTPNFYGAVEVAKYIKRNANDVPIILGGPHATARPGEVLGYECFDYVVLGEGDESLSKLVRCISEKNGFSGIDGLAYRRSGQVVIQPKSSYIQDIDSLPFPSYHLLSLNEYPEAPHGTFYKKRPFISMFTSRGCPYDCAYCANPNMWGHAWRARSPEKIVTEISYLTEKFRIKEIHFEDDNFTLSRNRVIKICQGILENNMDIAWKCPNGVRVEQLDLETIQLMRRAGCYSLSFGIESGVQEILDNVNKDLDLSKLRRVISWARDAGIFTIGFFIFGLPGETPDTIESTIRYAKSLDLDATQFNIFVPFPGTELFDLYDRKGHIKTYDWSKYDVDHLVFETEDIRTEDVFKLRRKAFKQFYLRPKIILSNLRQVSSLNNFLWLSRRVMRVL